MSNDDLSKPILLGQSGDSMREAFGRALVQFADEFPNLVVLDGDVAGGTGTHNFRSIFPDRFFQFGIAEQNMVSAAAGMASAGLIPVVSTFAVFSLRAIEQVRLSVALAETNVKIVASHPGLDVGPDGASAQAVEDLAIFRSLPNMTVISPADPIEMLLATNAILKFKGPIYMRTGRSPVRRIFDESHEFKIGRGHVLRDGKDVAIISCGVQVARALDASKALEAEGVSALVINMATIKPLDEDLVLKTAASVGCFVVTEDHNVIGGLGGAVAEVLARTLPCPIEFVGIQDVFGESGEPDELAEHYKLTPSHIVSAASRVIDRKNRIERK